MKLALFTLTCLVCAAAHADLKKLNGTWRPISGAMGGGELPKAMLDKMVLTLKDGAYDYDEGHGHDLGTVKLVGKQGMDILGAKGPNKGHAIPAIYQYDGKVLTICYGSGKTRPTAFDAKAKGSLFMIKYRRAN